MSKRTIPDYLSTLVSDDLVRIWKPETMVAIERELWIEVMFLQRRLGLKEITLEELRDSERYKSSIDLASIQRRELRTRHDLKARLEEFCYIAGHEHFHLGMTSADVVENVALIRMRQSLMLLGQTYNRPHLLEMAYILPFRGIKGPVGTQQDMLDLLGSEDACDTLDTEVAEHFGFMNVVNSVPQVMYRSIDLQVASELVNTTFQVRSPLQAILRGYLHMILSYQGDTWNEGDVSSSAIRRVALPGIFFATDALLQTERGTLGS
jgi:adenylosuccinate lyase